MKAKTTGSIVIAVIAAAITVFFVFCRDAPVEAAYPIERVGNAARRSLSIRLRALWRAQSVIAENARLRREVASLSLVRSDAERVEIENARLRRALDYVARAPEDWIAAEVLSEGGGAAGKSGTLRLGVGERAGIAEGAVVVVPEGLVGRVTRVTARTCEVTPLTDPSVQVAFEVESPGGTYVRGVTAGGTADQLKFRHVRGTDGFEGGVPPRSRVVTSGLGGVFPGGIEIGAWTDDGIIPSVDFTSLADVFVRRKR